MKVPTECKCVIDERKFSWSMLALRLITSAATIYFMAGILLNFRAFTDSTSFMLRTTIPSAVIVAVCIMGLAACFCLIFGYRTKLTAFFLMLLNMAAGIIFTGEYTNKIFLFFVLLSIASILPLILMGAGRFSMDFRSVVAKSEDFLTK
ncbi:putative membrane protein YphA (DoxX/SURF4 family) [Elusimicrobium posterum]|uniref:hypothetical protein n=1 Tax=Elusimicrobium posterum TaxID=3116653 RepID=UPI003C75F134